MLFMLVGKPIVEYSDCFSFNHPQGWCVRCDGQVVGYIGRDWFGISLIEHHKEVLVGMEWFCFGKWLYFV